jgi:hypothetical protein
MLASDRLKRPVDRLTEAQFFQAVESNNIVAAKISYDPQA